MAMLQPLFSKSVRPYTLSMHTLLVIYTTTTGHTEHVIDVLERIARETSPDVRIRRQRAEQTKAEDLAQAEYLLLACGSWNTGNVEGQLSPHMHDLLVLRAKDAELRAHAAAIGLGDERYYYTARAAEKLTEYLQTHGAQLLLPTLKIINDPFGQEAKVESWAKEMLRKIGGEAPKKALKKSSAPSKKS